jgi:membrane protein YdbS with pleckstrin-like domain
VNTSEQLVWQVSKSATPEIWGKLLGSLGLYGFWLRANRCIVTNRKVMHQTGVFSKEERAIQLERIQDVSSKIGPLTGSVTVSSAGVVSGVSITIGPLWRNQAEKLSQVIQEKMQARR